MTRLSRLTPLPIPPSHAAHLSHRLWQCYQDYRAGGEPPTPSPPPEDYRQILAASPKLEDGLHFEDCEYDGRIWPAAVIIYKFSGQ
jgi:hypothetical protein